jgi:hypothetical protein
MFATTSMRSTKRFGLPGLLFALLFAAHPTAAQVPSLDDLAGAGPSQTYNASNGGSFAETIIRGFFGYQPDLLRETLVPDPRPRGFQGQLLNVRHHGGSSNLTSTDQGIESGSAKQP